MSQVVAIEFDMSADQDNLTFKVGNHGLDKEQIVVLEKMLIDNTSDYLTSLPQYSEAKTVIEDDSDDKTSSIKKLRDGLVSTLVECMSDDVESIPFLDDIIKESDDKDMVRIAKEIRESVVEKLIKEK